MRNEDMPLHRCIKLYLKRFKYVDKAVKRIFFFKNIDLGHFELTALALVLISIPQFLES